MHSSQRYSMDDDGSSWVPLFDSAEDSFLGHVTSLETVNEIIKKYEIETTTKYCIFKTVAKNFGKTGVFFRLLLAIFQTGTFQHQCAPISTHLFTS